MRKLDLMALAFLVFAVVIVVAIVRDPQGFSLKEWQPLTAATIALGSAGIVFRGAKLAYEASMQKVALDREIHMTELRQRQRGLFLRLRFAVHWISTDAQWYADQTKAPQKGSPPIKISPGKFKLTTAEMVEEAWSNPDAFPPPIARALSGLKFELVAFENTKSAFNETETIELQDGIDPPLNVQYIHNTTTSMAEFAKDIFEELDREIADAPTTSIRDAATPAQPGPA